MNPKQIISLVIILGASISLQAQSKILQTIQSDATASTSRKVIETTDRSINQTVDNILNGSIFKKKVGKNKTDVAMASNEQTIIDNAASGTELTIANIDYSSIVALTDVIKLNKNVTDVQRSFNNGSGVINVIHTCKTEELLDDILKNTSGKYDVAELNKGRITLKKKI